MSAQNRQEFTDKGALALSTADEIIGLPEPVAIEIIQARGLSYRIKDKDGNAFLATRDYRTDRLNLSIINDFVEKVSLG